MIWLINFKQLRFLEWVFFNGKGVLRINPAPVASSSEVVLIKYLIFSRPRRRPTIASSLLSMISQLTCTPHTKKKRTKNKWKHFHIFFGWVEASLPLIGYIGEIERSNSTISRLTPVAIFIKEFCSGNT